MEVSTEVAGTQDDTPIPVSTINRVLQVKQVQVQPAPELATLLLQAASMTPVPQRAPAFSSPGDDQKPRGVPEPEVQLNMCDNDAAASLLGVAFQL